MPDQQEIGGCVDRNKQARKAAKYRPSGGLYWAIGILVVGGVIITFGLGTIAYVTFHFIRKFW